MSIRHMFASSRATALIGSALLGAGVASAAPPVEFNFQQLESSYQASTSVLTISAEDQPGFFSYGLMRRNFGTTGVTLFDQGFVSEPNPSDFQLALTITQITPSSALAIGPLTITDVDGDTFSAMIDGVFHNHEGVSTLVGAMTGMAFVSDEGTFDGPDGGVFSTSFPAGMLSFGTLRLSFVNGPRSFDGDFAEAETGLVGWIPAPSGAALLALAGLAAARRRR